MDINEPLHAQIHFWIIAAVIVLGYIAVVGNKIWTKWHIENKRTTRIVISAVLAFYSFVYAFLTFFYRTPMGEAHIRLEPLWSYREAFEGWQISRLGIARSIVLNIAITVPLGYLLPGAFRFIKHRYLWTIATVLCLSLVTELIQLLTRTGLAETDDVINNTMGAGIGLIWYWIADKLLERKKKV